MDEYRMQCHLKKNLLFIILYIENYFQENAVDDGDDADDQVEAANSIYPSTAYRI